ncbi:hypothetical protein M0812_03622 [Anaeramoeba flamelloides]|uniref:Uncharacterized protein n=1 Tax=Anaeramoeba flamelloides TaxID=1746091 RepID=A0AAV8AE43_9EUKA|nr:hypothetical protein M0812_03622 [Anaeramoeba flamelloides]|eukprot:Anaeramoba_flamelloidesa816329_178.p1 GENE.a816329_178~~a816329_178.p1  ORF type:complete len:254 (-),score=63.16 a816329_178:88-849(-)
MNNQDFYFKKKKNIKRSYTSSIDESGMPMNTHNLHDLPYYEKSIQDFSESDLLQTEIYPSNFNSRGRSALTSHSYKLRRLNDNIKTISRRPSAPKNDTASLIPKVLPFWIPQNHDLNQDFTIDDCGSFEGLIDDTFFEELIPITSFKSTTEIEEREEIPQKTTPRKKSKKKIEGKTLYHNVLLNYIKKLRSQNEELLTEFNKVENELLELKNNYLQITNNKNSSNSNDQGGIVDSLDGINTQLNEKENLTNNY